MIFRLIPLLTAAVTTLSLGAPSHASESGKRIEIAGPVTADVIRVIDGDTISFPDGRNPAQEMLSAGYVSP